jgi:nucleoid-associated protein YejK
MVNFEDLSFKRISVHTILKKDPDEEFANVLLNMNLVVIDESASDIIKRRLNDAAHKTAKAFELYISDTLESGFFGYSREFPINADSEFVRSSGKIAQLLANATKSSAISGGYLIIIDGYTSSGHQVAVVIKAELHEAFVLNGNSLNILRNIFLSPTQRFLKFGVIFERRADQIEEKHVEMGYPNDQFGCLLYDDQFRTDSIAAEYFFKDFLGFSTEFNPKIQTKRFYEATQKYIANSFETNERKMDLATALNSSMKNTNELEFSPNEFAMSYFTNEEMIENYANEIAIHLPENIEKDITLINRKLNSKKLSFPNHIVLSGPESAFEDNVIIINDNEELKNLNVSQDSYTIVKVKGKPFRV